MRRQALVFVTAVVVVVGGAAAATAKDFRPGDLRVCGATRCVPITSRALMPQLSSFYYLGPTDPVRTFRPALGARMYELRFRNGYVTGVVATAQLNRFLSYGVNLTRFHKGVWYRVPPAIASELRRLATTLQSLHVDASTPSKSH